MKTIYIPKGEVVHYESLSTGHLIAEGTLEVTRGIHAKLIDGDGVIHAETVKADIIRIRCLETSLTVCRRLIAKVVECPEVYASESAAVSCFPDVPGSPELYQEIQQAGAGGNLPPGFRTG